MVGVLAKWAIITSGEPYHWASGQRVAPAGCVGWQPVPAETSVVSTGFNR